MKTIDIVNAYKVLESAKMSTLSDEDKFALIKTMRKFKKIYTDYNELLESGREQLKDDNFNAMVLKAQKWQQEGENTTLSETERIEINNYFGNYENKINDFIKEESEREFDDFRKISEDGFSKLISANNWDMKTILSLDGITLGD